MKKRIAKKRLKKAGLWLTKTQKKKLIEGVTDTEVFNGIVIFNAKATIE